MPRRFFHFVFFSLPLVLQTPSLSLGNLIAQEEAMPSASQLLQIAPTSDTCYGASFPSECRTAEQAAPYIAAAFHEYGITHTAVKAALISLMVYESGEFKYNENHWPGVPGQGTRNMQSLAFNLKYAESIPALSSQLDAPGVQDDPAAVLALVEPDKYSFASAAWFITSQCGLDVRKGMWGGSHSGWEDYITDCVGTSPEEGNRLEYWQTAIKALGA